MPLAGYRALPPASCQHCGEKLGVGPASAILCLSLVNSPLSFLLLFIHPLKTTLSTPSRFPPGVLLLSSFINSEKKIFELLLCVRHCFKGVGCKWLNKIPAILKPAGESRETVDKTDVGKLRGKLRDKYHGKRAGTFSLFWLLAFE